MFQARGDGGLAQEIATEMLRGRYILDAFLEFLGLTVRLNVEHKGKREIKDALR